MATDAYGAASDHAALSGLTVGDPHTQYTRTLWGTAAARPAQPIREGTRYIATDTGAESVSTGSSWYNVALDTHTHDTTHTHPAAARGFVKATRNPGVGGGQAYTSQTWTTVDMTAVVQDVRSEYNLAADTYTPLSTGPHLVTVSQHWDFTLSGNHRVLYGVWTAAGVELMRINDVVMPSFPGHCAPLGTGLIQLTAGTAYVVRCYISPNSYTTIAATEQNYLTWAAL